MAQTMDSDGILYLRPRTEQAIALLDVKKNKDFVDDRPPPPELCDTRLEGIPERIPASHLSPHTTHEPNSNISRESTPGPYSIYPRVLRLGFFTKTVHTARGYYFGSLPDCQVEMPYHDNRSSKGCYFCIHYNFNSGALLIVAMSTIFVGSTRLTKDNSLLVMADTIVDCGGGAFQFMVEFPDLSQCAAPHERNYEEYVAKFNLQNALYMATSREQDPPIGHLHRIKAVLGHGACGEVHKAVHIHTGELCAMKMLPDNDEQDALHEIKVLSELSHVSYLKHCSHLLLTSDSQISSNTGMHLSSRARCVSSRSWLPMIFTSIETPGKVAGSHTFPCDVSGISCTSCYRLSNTSMVKAIRTVT